MKNYLYELHCHTSVASRCSNFTPQEIVDFYSSLCYDGVFITDHFLNGNTTVDKTKPWEKQIDDYCKGYEQVKKIAEKTRLKVFFGLEYSYNGTDFIIYNISKKFLKIHPEIMTLPVKECMYLFRLNGGFVIQAHPTREANYIDHIRLFPRSVDAVEVFNANRTDLENNFAKIYADTYNLLKTCGSDIHRHSQTTLATFVSFNELFSVNDLVSTLKSGNYLMKKKIIA